MFGDASANNSWVLGFPSKPDTDGCASYSSKCWMNGYESGNYLSNEFSWVLSPFFNFSELTTDPILRFALNLKTEDYYDGFFIQAWNESMNEWQTIGPVCTLYIPPTHSRI